jgi:predicted amidohydrolase YtcJ
MRDKGSARKVAGVVVLSLSAVAVLLSRGGAHSSGAHLTQEHAPDLVLVNGRIFTADSATPWAEALAIRGDRIIAVGSTSAISALAGPDTRRVELRGHLVIPGLNDAHSHLGAPLPGVPFQTSDDPVPDPALATVRDSLRALVRRTPAGTWLRTEIDATLLDDPKARRDTLDAVAPRHPVWLEANTGHGVIINTAALRALGIGDSALDPIGGFYEREGAPYPGRGRGRVTGLMHEYAAWNAAKALRSAQPDSVLVAALHRRAEQALSFGVTSVQNMASAFDPATTLRVFCQARLPIRVRIIPMPGTDRSGGSANGWRTPAREPVCTGGTGAPVPAGATPPAMKWILDGTGIERLSLLRAPYADRPGWAGQLNFPPDTLRALLSESLAAGEQPILHAIGDSTIALALTLMESIAPDSTWRRLRPRLEHAEWLTPDLRARARRLGAVVVQNPTHFTDGEDLMYARFGADRSANYQPFRGVLEAGIPLAIGSDGPFNPFLNLYFAVLHPDNPPEALSLEAAVVAYTRGSAYAEHAEHEKGRLAPGMLADLAVLSQDIFAVPVTALPETRSVLTLVGGVMVYEAGLLPVLRSAAGLPSTPSAPYLPADL